MQQEIEDYLDGKLDPDAKHAFEIRLLEDPDFEQAYNSARRMRQDLDWLAVGQRVKLAETEFWRQKKAKSRRNIILFGLVALSLLVVLTLWRRRGTSTPQSTPAPEQNDSTATLPDRLDPDTLQLKKQPPGGSNVGKKLFAVRFKPYRDESLEPASRGNDTLAPLEQFRSMYWDGKYPETLRAFEKLSAYERENDNNNFLIANALLATGRSKPAVIILEKIVRNNKTRFMAQAQWYLVLAYLNEDRLEDARNLLLEIENDGAFYHRKEARELLDKLNLIFSTL